MNSMFLRLKHKEFSQVLGRAVAAEVHSQVFSREGAFFQELVTPTAALVRLCSPSVDRPGA